MSADNGVYIGVFPVSSAPDSKKEYRVEHAQCIENCDDTSLCPTEITDAYRVLYYKDAKVFENESEAMSYASKLADEILSDDFCPVLEYGIQQIEYNRPLATMSLDEAHGIIEGFFNNG